VQPLTLQRGVFDRRGTFFGVDDLTKSIWSYRDGRWRDLTADLGLTVREYAAVAANPHADQVIVVDRGGQGYTTTDGGATWNSVSHSAKAGEGDPPWLRVANAPFFTTADMMFDPAVPNRVWVAAGMGVFYADVPPGTGALDWVSQTRGIEELVANDVIQPSGGSPIFAGWDFGIHVKDDLNAYSTTFGPRERALMTVPQLDWTTAKPSFVVSNASDARMGCCSEDGNAVMAGTSTDGGRKWTKLTTIPGGCRSGRSRSRPATRRTSSGHPRSTASPITPRMAAAAGLRSACPGRAAIPPDRSKRSGCNARR
jgi:hypothetical protein